ncbi:hypothetical protein ACIOUG_18935 [Pseudomonas sp. NPDC087803]|uniref:hypothetical protein n=1 Tax=Pseudomonas sp. NPDC087803 TaxID=3364448 RepID=UPI0037FB4853
MALTPIDEIHALQIQAGVLGRKAGHFFEDCITKEINTLTYPFQTALIGQSHVFSGDPALLLLNYIGNREGIRTIQSAVAISTGALATSEAGKQWLSINGASVSRCKSDLVITLVADNNQTITVGVSTKQCNNRIPTNAQLYFTTAIGFSNLLRSNGISVSDRAVYALRQFCGDQGFRPLDELNNSTRLTDPRRYFWEEIDAQGRLEWEEIFTYQQDQVSRLLFQKAYLNDPFTPDYILHKTKASSGWNQTEVAIYSVDEIIDLSRAYGGFRKRSYSVRKGSYKDPQGVEHDAPRFGIIQMQRGGQAQHPQQLQFNLEAGYFYKI